MRFGSLALLSFAAVLSCKEPTQITVLLTTTAACPEQDLGNARLVDVGIAAQVSFPKQTEATFTATTNTCDAPPEVGSLVLVPSEGRDGDRVEVLIVAGLETDDGKAPETTTSCDEKRAGPGIEGSNCIVVRRRLGFVDGLPLVLPLELDKACLGVECGEDLTCFKGGCVDPDVECETTQTCRDPEPPTPGGGGSGAGGSGAGGSGAGGSGAGGSGAGGSGAGGSGANGAGGSGGLLAGGSGGDGGSGGAVNGGGGSGGAVNGGGGSGGAVNGGGGSGGGTGGSGAGGFDGVGGSGGVGVGGNGAGGFGGAGGSGGVGVGGNGAGGFGGVGGSGGSMGVGGAGSGAENCSNNVDDDGDSSTDCGDPDCIFTLWCNDEVVINEFSAVDAGEDEEFIELWNPTSQTVQLDGGRLILFDASGSPYADYDLAGISLPPAGYFLLQDSLLTVPPDVESLPLAISGPDHVKQDGPRGIALYRDDSQGDPMVLDGVVYASAMPIAGFSIDGGIYSALAYSISDVEAPNGDSIARIPNGASGNGDGDWVTTTNITRGLANQLGGGKGPISVDYPVITRSGRLVITGTNLGDTSNVLIDGVGQTYTVPTSTQIIVSPVNESTPLGDRQLTVESPSGNSSRPITVINLLVSEVNSISAGPQFDFVEVETNFQSAIDIGAYTLVHFSGATNLAVYAQPLGGVMTDTQGYLVVGGPSVSPFPEFATPTLYDLSSGPAAVAIYQGAFASGQPATALLLIDALVYGPTNDPDLAMILMLEQTLLTEQAGSSSIQRCHHALRRNGMVWNHGAPSPSAPQGGIISCPFLETP